jgi:hypothetical protein
VSATESRPGSRAALSRRNRWSVAIDMDEAAVVVTGGGGESPSRCRLSRRPDSGPMRYRPLAYVCHSWCIPWPGRLSSQRIQAFSSSIDALVAPPPMPSCRQLATQSQSVDRLAPRSHNLPGITPRSYRMQAPGQ